MRLYDVPPPDPDACERRFAVLGGSGGGASGPLARGVRTFAAGAEGACGAASPSGRAGRSPARGAAAPAGTVDERRAEDRLAALAGTAVAAEQRVGTREPCRAANRAIAVSVAGVMRRCLFMRPCLGFLRRPGPELHPISMPPPPPTALCPRFGRLSVQSWFERIDETRYKLPKQGASVEGCGQLGIRKAGLSRQLLSFEKNRPVQFIEIYPRALRGRRPAPHARAGRGDPARRPARAAVARLRLRPSAEAIAPRSSVA